MATPMIGSSVAAAGGGDGGGDDERNPNDRPVPLDGAPQQMEDAPPAEPARAVSVLEERVSNLRTNKGVLNGFHTQYAMVQHLGRGYDMSTIFGILYLMSSYEIAMGVADQIMSSNDLTDTRIVRIMYRMARTLRRSMDNPR